MKIAISLISGIVIGIIVMDRFNYYFAKYHNIEKPAGIFTYTPAKKG